MQMACITNCKASDAVVYLRGFGLSSGVALHQVALMACSMTMCGIMLESILESSSEFVSPAQEAEFFSQCRFFCKGSALLPCHIDKLSAFPTPCY